MDRVCRGDRGARGSVHDSPSHSVADHGLRNHPRFTHVDVSKLLFELALLVGPALYSLLTVGSHPVCRDGSHAVRRRRWPERWRCLHAQTDRPLPDAAARHVADGVRTTERERRTKAWHTGVRRPLRHQSRIDRSGLLSNRSGLGSGELLYLVSPIAASCIAFLLWDRWGEGPASLNWRAPLIAMASAAIPPLILLVPHMVAGQVPAFVNGVFVLPQQRLQYTRLGMRPASQIVAAAAALMWICWSPATLSAREIRFLNVVRWLVGVGLVLLALRSRLWRTRSSGRACVARLHWCRGSRRGC